MHAESKEPRPSQSTAMDRSLLSGLAWTGLVKWGTQILSWASTLIVARILVPEDYGIMGIATVYIGLVEMVSEFGLGTALIQKRDLNSSQIARLGGLAVLVSVALFAISAGLAAPLAAFFEEPRARDVILLLSAVFVVTSFQIVPNSLLSRDLAFRQLAIAEGVVAVVQTLATLGLAYAGAHYWALVFGAVIGKTLRTAILIWMRPHAIAWPRDLASLHRTITFGWRVVVTRLAWYAYSNADFVVIGRVLGTAPLGAYTLGWNLATIPVNKVTSVVSRVMMPVLSAVQSDRAAVGRYLLLISEAIVVIVLPASLGLALVAPDFVSVVLGEQWGGAVVPLQALSVHVTFRCMLPAYVQALFALGEDRQSVRVGIRQLLIMPAAFYIAATQWGINGVAITWLIVHPLITIPPFLLYTLRRVDLAVGSLLRALWPAISSGGVMVIAVVAAQLALSEASAPVRLAAATAVGAISYGGAILVFHRGRLRHVMGRLKALRK